MRYENDDIDLLALIDATVVMVENEEMCYLGVEQASVYDAETYLTPGSVCGCTRHRSTFLERFNVASELFLTDTCVALRT